MRASALTLRTLVRPASRPSLVAIRHNSSVPNTEASKQDEDEQGAMQRRLEELAESARPIPEDPKAGISTITEEDLIKLQERVSQASFERNYPRAYAEHTLPRAADKLTRNIAADTPWTGEESTHDGVLRMLTDVHKPIKVPVPKPTLDSLPLRGPSKPKTPKSPPVRILAAKEATQGYTLLKEKFSPGFRPMPATMEGFTSLAEERILDARNRGQFNNLPGRGKPPTKDHLAESPYLDRTGIIAQSNTLIIEYFLNRILQRQGAAPPWIQAQIDLTSAFANFRESLRQEWLRHVTRQITTSTGNLATHISLAESYVERDIAANYSIREYKSEWESREEKYHSLAIEDLNSKTRGYNTIAPYSARKTYTTLERELFHCYKDVAPQIVETIRNRANAEKARIPSIAAVRGAFENLRTQSQVSVYVNRDGHSGIIEYLRRLIVKD